MFMGPASHLAPGPWTYMITAHPQPPYEVGNAARGIGWFGPAQRLLPVKARGEVPQSGGAGCGRRVPGSLAGHQPGHRVAGVKFLRGKTSVYL